MAILWRRILAGESGSLTGRRSDHTEGVKPEARGLTPAIWSPSFKARMATGSVLHKAGTCNLISEAWTKPQGSDAYTRKHWKTACYLQAAEKITAEGFSVRGVGFTASLVGRVLMCCIQIHTNWFMMRIWRSIMTHIFWCPHNTYFKWQKADLCRAEQEMTRK